MPTTPNVSQDPESQQYAILLFQSRLSFIQSTERKEHLKTWLSISNDILYLSHVEVFNAYYIPTEWADLPFHPQNLQFLQLINVFFFLKHRLIGLLPVTNYSLPSTAIQSTGIYRTVALQGLSLGTQPSSWKLAGFSESDIRNGSSSFVSMQFQ